MVKRSLSDNIVVSSDVSGNVFTMLASKEIPTVLEENLDNQTIKELPMLDIETKNVSNNELT